MAMEWLLESGRFNMKPGMKKVSIDLFMGWLKRNMLLVITFAGVSLGVLVGLLLRKYQLDSVTVSYIAYPGELFMRLLKLMILPLIIASLITGSASLNAKMNGMVALRTIVYFLVTSLISAIIGLVLVLWIHPGNPETKKIVGEGNTEERKIDIVDNFLDLGRNLFPDNLFQASFQTAHTEYMSKDGKDVTQVAYRSGTNTLGIIFFCLAFGTVLGSLGKAGKTVIDFFVVIDEVINKMVYGIMWISPIGIGSVICAKILSVEDLAEVMSQLGWFIITVVGGVFLYQFSILQLIYFIFVRKNPFVFWAGLFQTWMTAFATASTAAALPITFRCMTENNRVDPRISKFVLPIGATVNMDGTALFVTVASIFIAQINGMVLNAGDLVTVVLTATATSVAAASVPSAALVLMLIVLSAIDAPVQDVSLLWAVDWFVDRCRTTNNMLGDCYGAAVVEALSKKELEAMDKEAEKERRKELEEDLESGHETIVKKVKKGVSEERISNASSASLNGSSVEVPAVIIVDDSEREEDVEDQKM